MAKKKKFYVVWEGHNPGVYDNWAACQAQTKNYPQAKYKSFPTLEAAKSAFNSGFSDYIDFTGKNAKPKPVISEAERARIVWDSIAVDAASSGNPGVMEYQGVLTANGQQLFHQKFELGTNNIGEFLALVHGLAYLKQQGKNTPIYTDSKIAMGWITAKKCRTKLARTRKTEALYQIIARAEKWLQSNTFSNKIMKWETKVWGEIPADFGRK